MAVRGRAAAPSTELILIVDDDQETRQLYVERLTGFGLRVDGATTTVEALSKSLLHPSVICVAVSAESSEQLELCRRVRQNPRTRRIPLIAVVDARLPGEALRAREAGVDSVLMTPCPAASLGAEVRRVLNRARAVRGLTTGPLPATTTRLDTLRTRVGRRVRTFLKASLPDHRS